jgi:hypothetical protein
MAAACGLGGNALPPPEKLQPPVGSCMNLCRSDAEDRTTHARSGDKESSVLLDMSTVDSSSSCSDAWQKGNREISCSVQDIPNLPAKVMPAKDAAVEMTAKDVAEMPASGVAEIPTSGAAEIPTSGVAKVAGTKIVMAAKDVAATSRKNKISMDSIGLTLHTLGLFDKDYIKLTDKKPSMKVLRQYVFVLTAALFLCIVPTVSAAICGNVDGTQINVGTSCTCGSVTCTPSTGLYCVAERSTCYQSALPGPPKSVDVRVFNDNNLQVTIEPPDGGANITHYNVSTTCFSETNTAPSNLCDSYIYYRLYITANGGASYAVDGATKSPRNPTVSFTDADGDVSVTCGACSGTVCGRCSASACDASQGCADCAFTNACTKVWTTYRTGSHIPAWLKYQFESSKRISGYRVESTANPVVSITAWRFEGSNDGSSWTTLDTKTGQDTSGKRQSYTLGCTTVQTTETTKFRINANPDDTVSSSIVSVPNSSSIPCNISARACHTLGCSLTSANANTASPCQPPHAYLKDNLCWACPLGSSSTTINATACFGSCGNIDGSDGDFASCISGTNHLKTNPDSVTCATDTCVVNDCCDSNPTCGDINGDGSNVVFDSCGGSEEIKSSPKSITCTTGTCATSDCCNQATCAQITDGASGGDFVCGAFSTIKSNKITINCGATPCLTNSDSTQNNACCDACASVTDGTCTACTTAVASGCTAVTCDAGYVDADTNAANGCELSCASVTDGTCTACTSAVASGCTAVTCATNKFDTNGNAADGCEAGCSAVTDGTCTACTSAVAS